MKPSIVDLSRLTPLDSLYEEVRLARSYRIAAAVRRAWLRFSRRLGWKTREEEPHRWPLILRTSPIGEDPEIVSLVFPKVTVDLPTLEAALSWED